MQELENSMVVDALWEETDYGVPNKRRLKREKRVYEEAEREDREDD